MQILTLTLGDKQVSLNVSREDVWTSEARKVWMAAGGTAGFSALFEQAGWCEGPVAMMRRLLAENPEASEDERRALERKIERVKAYRAEHGDPWQGRDD